MADDGPRFHDGGGDGPRFHDAGGDGPRFRDGGGGDDGPRFHDGGSGAGGGGGASLSGMPPLAGSGGGGAPPGPKVMDLIDPVYKAMHLLRRRKFDECIDVCTRLLDENPRDQVRLAARRAAPCWRVNSGQN